MPSDAPRQTPGASAHAAGDRQQRVLIGTRAVLGARQELRLRHLQATAELLKEWQTHLTQQTPVVLHGGNLFEVLDFRVPGNVVVQVQHRPRLPLRLRGDLLPPGAQGPRHGAHFARLTGREGLGIVRAAEGPGEGGLDDVHQEPDALRRQGRTPPKLLHAELQRLQDLLGGDIGPTGKTQLIIGFLVWNWHSSTGRVIKASHMSRFIHGRQTIESLKGLGVLAAQAIHPI